MAMDKNRRGMLLAAFLGDAFSLGAHWIYDTTRINQEFGLINNFVDPLGDTYHLGKERGDFTHYGDQTLLLLKFISDYGEYSSEFFMQQWFAYMSKYNGYVDNATSETLANIKAGKNILDSGSTSEDLSIVGRMLPILYYKKERAVVDECLEFCKLTHSSQLCLDCTEYIADVISAIIDGGSPLEAIENCLSANSEIQELVEVGLASIDRDTTEVISELGQSCNIRDSLSSTIHLIAKYQYDFESALINNVMAGGDSAARGMLIGGILGAHITEDNLPTEWLNQINNLDKIKEYMS